MRWPPWSSSSGDGDDSDKNRDSQRARVSWAQNLNSTDWRQFTEPHNIFSTAILTSSILFGIYLHRNFIRRVPAATDIRPSWFRKRSLFGRVTSVGDGDGFNLYHTPGGRLLGWDWFPGRRVPQKRADLKNRTISVRLAGIDAPEMSHFGRPAQPYAEEALSFLRSYILHRRVRAYIYRRDQYDRALATVYVRRGLWRRNVGLELVRAGLATVYEAKSGMEYGGLEHKYRAAEAKAKRKRKGMWALKESEYESPMAFKKRVSGTDTP